MHDARVKAIRSPVSLKRLATNGAFPGANTPEEFAAYLHDGVRKWWPIIKENHIHADWDADRPVFTMPERKARFFFCMTPAHRSGAALALPLSSRLSP